MTVVHGVDAFFLFKIMRENGFRLPCITKSADIHVTTTTSVQNNFHAPSETTEPSYETATEPANKPYADA